MTNPTSITTALKFIFIKNAIHGLGYQSGKYLISMAHIVAIEMTDGDEITISMADGKDYTIQDHDEIDKIMNALDVL